MIHALYNASLSAVAPLGAGWLLCSRKHRRLLGRFAPRVPAGLEAPIWVHACSVGEVELARGLIVRLRARHPDWPVLLTVSTATGRTHAEATRAAEAIAWFPFDHPWAVRGFIRRARPRALVLIETEIWPNVILCAAQAHVPVVIVNGRISDRHFSRYSRYSRFFAPVFARVTAAGVQNPLYAQRLESLGVVPERIAVTGTMKFDGVRVNTSAEDAAGLRAECGLPEEAPVLVCGSTRPGEERLAVSCWRRLREANPELRLVLAPRHPDRMDSLSVEETGPVIRRSEVKAGKRPADTRFLIVDTVGELTRFYALAAVAVVGGGFFPGIGGHNPLEPAALGVPVVFGPHMEGFADAAAALLAGGAAVQVKSPDALYGALEQLLSDAAARAEIGRRGREVVLANRGAVERNLDVLERVLAEMDRTAIGK